MSGRIPAIFYEWLINCRIFKKFGTAVLFIRRQFLEKQLSESQIYIRPLSTLSDIRYTGLFDMIVGVLTTCHTQYTWDRSIFLFNRTTLQVFVTSCTRALYVYPLWFYKYQHDNRVGSKLFVACQRWWFQWRFWFVPSVPGYLREEEEHKPDAWRNPIERNHMGLHLENEVASW